MADLWSNPVKAFKDVVKSDTPNMGGCRGIWVGGTGTVVAIDRDGTTVTFSAVPAGTLLPISPRAIKVASTATGLVAMY
jgi:hypothetical protein